MYARTVVIWCDHRDPPSDLHPNGNGCYTEFESQPGARFRSLREIRKLAAADGWACVPGPGGRRLDLCPRHVPKEN